MSHRTFLALCFSLLILSALACSLPFGGSKTPEAPAAPTDAGFAPPTQPGGEAGTPAAAAPADATPGAAQPADPNKASKPENAKVTLGATSSLSESGLLNTLIIGFMNATGYEVVPEIGGAGRAFRLGEKYITDVLLVNEPGSEQKFIKDGYGKDRIPVFHADFLLLGPSNDPAGVKGMTSAIEALKKIATTQSKFVTRGDDSPAAMRENQLWKKAGITPSGDWYIKTGEGVVGAVKIASDKQAYILVARTTYLEAKTKSEIKLEVLVQGDTELFDTFHVITGNPEKSAKINYDGAMAFANYLNSPDIQALIAGYGVDKYGEPIYFPDAGK